MPLKRISNSNSLFYSVNYINAIKEECNKKNSHWLNTNILIDNIIIIYTNYTIVYVINGYLKAKQYKKHLSKVIIE